MQILILVIAQQCVYGIVYYLITPLNVEAKNLYLHLAAELGLIGLAVFCWVAWRYYQLFRFVIGTFPPSSDLYKITIGIHAALIGIAVAGLADTPVLHHTRSAATFA